MLAALAAPARFAGNAGSFLPKGKIRSIFDCIAARNLSKSSVRILAGGEFTVQAGQSIIAIARRRIPLNAKDEVRNLTLRAVPKLAMRVNARLAAAHAESGSP